MKPKYFFLSIFFIAFIFSNCGDRDDQNEIGCFIVENPNRLSTCELGVTPSGVSEVFKVVEDMPQFPGCDSISMKQERRECAEKLMEHFIKSNLIYPELAIANQIEGEVVISFIVETNGCLSNIRIIEDIGCGCGTEAQKTISQMPTWISGMQAGRPVRVQFNVPIMFEL